MAEIMNNAKQVNGGLVVLEDCSHAHGMMVDGKVVGSWGHMAAWSLQAKKNIIGGQAGVMATIRPTTMRKLSYMAISTREQSRKCPLTIPVGILA